MNIEFESSQHQDINDTPITHFDETRENGSDSNFIFEKVRRWDNVATERNSFIWTVMHLYWLFCIYFSAALV